MIAPDVRRDKGAAASRRPGVLAGAKDGASIFTNSLMES
jgi:hypothetical protein